MVEQISKVLADIFNSSMESGQVPGDWRGANVTLSVLNNSYEAFFFLRRCERASPGMREPSFHNEEGASPAHFISNETFVKAKSNSKLEECFLGKNRCLPPCVHSNYTYCDTYSKNNHPIFSFVEKYSTVFELWPGNDYPCRY